MTELMSSGALSMASLVVSLVLLVVGLVLWFFVNRASSRTGEQIALLEAMLVQQKKQTALLRRLCEANEPEQADEQVPAQQEPVAEPAQDEDDFIRIVAER
jgi:hypothetical protein